MKIETEPIVLKRLLTSSTFAASKLGSATRGTLKVEPAEHLRNQLGEMYWRMEAQLLASQVCADKQAAKVEYPTTWWQHLKFQLPGRRFGPWARRRWPVRMAKAVMSVSFTSYDTYPRADLQMPELGVPVHWDRTSIVSTEADAPGSIMPLSASISRQREYMRRQELEYWLRDEIGQSLAGQLGFSYFLAQMKNGGQKNPDPWVVVHEVMKALEGCQVNTSELVRRHAIERHS